MGSVPKAGMTQATVSGSTTTFTYDGDGRRVGKQPQGQAGISGLNDPGAVFDPAGGLPVLLEDDNRKYVWGPMGILSATDNAGARFYYHKDGLGSARAITSSAGATVDTYGYDAFGARSLGRRRSSLERLSLRRGAPG